MSSDDAAVVERGACALAAAGAAGAAADLRGCGSVWLARACIAAAAQRQSSRADLESSQAERDRATSSALALKAKLNVSEGDLAVMAGKHDAAQLERRVERQRAAQQHEELAKKCARLESRDVQYLAKLRRQEEDADKLRRQLRLQSSGGGAKRGATVSRPKAKPGATPVEAARLAAASALPPRPPPPASDLAAMLREAREQSAAALLEENAVLRAALGRLQPQLEALEAALPRAAADSPPPPPRAPAVGDRPAAWVEAHALPPLEDQLAALRGRLAAAAAAGPAEEAPAEDPAAALVEARALLAEQDALIERALAGRAATPRKQRSGGDGAVEHKEALAAARDALDAERALLARDRRIVAREAENIDAMRQRGEDVLKAACRTASTPTAAGAAAEPLEIPLSVTPETRAVLQRIGVSAKGGASPTARRALM